MYCKECGFQLSDDAKFCPNCGTKVELNSIGNIEDKAVWGNIDNEETEEVASEQISSKAQWNGNASNGTQKDIVSKPQPIVERKKIIRKKKMRVTGGEIIIGYWSYEDDENSELSPQWYEDSTGHHISDEYERVGSIDKVYKFAFVKDKNGKYACGKLENHYFRTLTPFVFDDYGPYTGSDDNGDSYFIYSTNEARLCTRVKYYGSWYYLSKDMILYATKESWWPSIIGSTIYSLFITAIIWIGVTSVEFLNLNLSLWVYIMLFAIILIIETVKEGKTTVGKEIMRF